MSGLSGFSDKVMEDRDVLQALGVTRISYNFANDKWSVTVPNPTYMTRKKTSWSGSSYDYQKSKTLTATSVDALKVKLAEILESGAKKKAEDLKKQATESLKKAEKLRVDAAQAEKNAETLLSMLAGG